MDDLRHYTYCILGEDGRFYYGSRSCQCDPRIDPYMGSYRDKTFIPKRKRVLKEFPCLDLAIIEEMRIHVTKNVGPNPRYANKATLRPRGMSRRGVPVSDQSRQRMRDAHLGKKHSEETKDKIRKSVTLVRKTDGKVFSFASQKEAATELGINMGNLSGVVNGKRQSAEGFTFAGND